MYFPGSSNMGSHHSKAGTKTTHWICPHTHTLVFCTLKGSGLTGFRVLYRLLGLGLTGFRVLYTSGVRPHRV